MAGDAPEGVRIDKWLWAARIVKTRGLAAEAVKGGRVQVNGVRVKPSRDVRPGDRVEVTLGATRLTLDVRGVARLRRPASEAALLYEETPESRAARARQADERRLAAAADASPPPPRGGARPTKRERRRYEAERRGRR